MLKAQQLTLAVLANAALISTAFASEQSESKGFVEDAETCADMFGELIASRKWNRDVCLTSNNPLLTASINGYAALGVGQVFVGPASDDPAGWVEAVVQQVKPRLDAI